MIEVNDQVKTDIDNQLSAFYNQLGIDSNRMKAQMKNHSSHLISQIMRNDMRQIEVNGEILSGYMETLAVYVSDENTTHVKTIMLFANRITAKCQFLIDEFDVTCSNGNEISESKYTYMDIKSVKKDRKNILCY